MATKRVVSLDIFRGITVAAMIFVNVLPLSPFTPEFLRHSLWIGLTIVDLVFPFFLFIVGVSMAYSFKHRVNQSKLHLWGHFLFRVAALYAIGLFLNWIGGGLPLRIPGVLQLIALASLFAAPLARTKIQWIILAAAVLLVVQSLILLFAGAPGVTPGNFQIEGNIAGWVDTQVFGAQHLFEPELHPDFDPEGIVATITATAMVLLGLIFGRTLQRKEGNGGTVKIFIISGAALIILGILISPWIPIIKQLWTASFVLVTAGLAALILTLIYIYIDIQDRKSLLRSAIPMGTNPLALYVLSAVVATFTVKFTLKSTSNDPISLYQMIYQPLMVFFTPNIGSIIYASVVVLFWGFVALYMYRRKIFIKL